MRLHHHSADICMMEDRDGDGVFEQAGVFAGGLVFPMGLAWRRLVKKVLSTVKDMMTAQPERYATFSPCSVRHPYRPR
mgnify:CR=1 FL=1